MRTIDQILADQEVSLAALEDAEARKFLRAFDDGRRELREKLDKMVASGADEKTRFTAQHYRIQLAQSEAAVLSLTKRLGGALDASTTRMMERSVTNLTEIVRRNEPEFRAAGSPMEFRVGKRLLAEKGLLLHKYSMDRYGADVVESIQRELVQGMVQGLTWDQVRDRIAGKEGSVLSVTKSRAELIVRTEMSSAYNAMHQAGLEEWAADDDNEDDPPMKKAIETRDLRNHAISRVLDGQIVPVKKPFRALVADVQREHAVLQAARAGKGLKARKLNGILWPLLNGAYTGQHQPAHFWDRGRVVAWRRSWGGDVAPSAIDVAPDTDKSTADQAETPEVLTASEVRAAIDAATTTEPARAPSPDHSPTGPSAIIRRGQGVMETSLRRQDDVAQILAEHGYLVERLPELGVAQNVPQPDFNIQGKTWDAYSPTGKMSTITRQLREKTTPRTSGIAQTERVVVNLAGTPVTFEELAEELGRNAPPNLKEVLVVGKDKRVRRIMLGRAAKSSAPAVTSAAESTSGVAATSGTSKTSNTALFLLGLWYEREQATAKARYTPQMEVYLLIAGPIDRAAVMAALLQVGAVQHDTNGLVIEGWSVSFEPVSENLRELSMEDYGLDPALQLIIRVGSGAWAAARAVVAAVDSSFPNDYVLTFELDQLLLRRTNGQVARTAPEPLYEGTGL